MGRFKYITLDRILSKLYRDLGIEEISETDVIEWSGEALEAIGAYGMYEEAVHFTEVENHQAELPPGLSTILQVARNNRWTKKEKKNCSLSISEIDNIEIINDTCPANDGVPIDCNGDPLCDLERAYYRPYFDLQYEYFGWVNSNTYKSYYTPVRLSNHTFFNTLVAKETDDNVLGLYNNSVDEYTVVDNMIRCSFESGYIAISYLRQVTDQNTGYPMIPDNYSFITAITKYITMKVMERYWYMGREGYSEKVKQAVSDWHWYARQAKNEANIPQGLDEYQNILEDRSYLIPRRGRYYGFFGRLGKLQANRRK